MLKIPGFNKLTYSKIKYVCLGPVGIQQVGSNWYLTQKLENPTIKPAGFLVIKQKDTSPDMLYLVDEQLDIYNCRIDYNNYHSNLPLIQIGRYKDGDAIEVVDPGGVSITPVEMAYIKLAIKEYAKNA